MPTSTSHSARNGSNGSKPPKPAKIESTVGLVPQAEEVVNTPPGAAPTLPVNRLPVLPQPPKLKLPLPAEWPHPAPLLDGTPEADDPQFNQPGAMYQAMPLAGGGVFNGIQDMMSDEALNQAVYKSGFNPVDCVTKLLSVIQESPPYLAVTWEVAEQPISFIAPDGTSIPTATAIPPLGQKSETRLRGFNAIVNLHDPDEVILRESGKSQNLPYAHCVIPALLKVIEAVQRAKKLLWQNLSPNMQEELALHHYFTVQGEFTKRLYRLKVGRTHNVERLGYHGRPEGSYCIHVRGWVPNEDNTLVMKLILESNEREFLRTANFMRYSGMGDADISRTAMEMFLQRLEIGDPNFQQTRGIHLGDGIGPQPYVQGGALPMVYPRPFNPQQNYRRGPNPLGDALQRMAPQIMQMAQQAVQPGGALAGIANQADLDAGLANLNAGAVIAQ